MSGLLVLLLSLAAGHVTNRWWVSEATICVVAGAVLSPFLRQLFAEPPFAGGGLELLHTVARLTLGVAVMGAALRLPGGWFWSHRRTMARILIVGMPAMWLTGSAAAALALPASLLEALLIGAVIAPTDPVVSAAVVTGRTAHGSVAERLRNTLTAESGANDGLGLLFVMLPLLLIQYPPPQAIGEWLAHTLLWQVVLSVGMGLLVGAIAGRVFLWANRKPDAEHHSMLAVSVALALTVLMLGRLIGSDGILAVFAAGLAFNRCAAQTETRQEELQGAMSRFLDLPVFLLFGAMLPWSEWRQLGWAGLAFAIAVLALRRLPWWLLFRGFDRHLSRREVLFGGWFGPVGVAAIYYALLADERLEIAWLWPAASLVVCLSVILHGVSATPLAQRMGSSRAAT